ncbi:MAG: metallophosphoesterase [Solobacterium sp.]|nr:metallophosphoesterase [Solobacterium sp.]
MSESQLIKIVAVSDNHSLMDLIPVIPMEFPNADYFLHCGDSREPVRRYGPYAQVRGNNDFYNVPEQRILELGEHRIFMTHGTRLVYIGSYDYLAEAARKNDCDIALFGHTHVYCDEMIDGVRCLNPGSLWHNRDGSEPSFMVIELEGKEVRAYRKDAASLNSKG